LRDRNQNKAVEILHASVKKQQKTGCEIHGVVQGRLARKCWRPFASQFSIGKTNSHQNV